MWNFLKAARSIRDYTDYRTPLYWMDFGNAQSTGQVILGAVQKKIP